jgi:hypothetical protein
VIKGKVVCKVKRGADGSIERYEIRYVGCGYDQTEGVDYFQHYVSAPTGQHATLRVLLVHAAALCCMIRHTDISTAFLHGELSDNETVYVEQPPILNDGTDRVWRLKISLNDLKQSGRKWYEKLVSLLHELGFKKAGYNPASFIRCADTEVRYIFIWVDDLIIVATQSSCGDIVKHVLNTAKGRDPGAASLVLGMSIKRDIGSKQLRFHKNND